MPDLQHSSDLVDPTAYNQPAAAGREAPLVGDDMIALRDSARVTLQQTIDIVATGVRREKFAMSKLLEARFREALSHLLMARDELA